MGICLVRLPSKSLFLGAEVLCFLLVYNERPSGKNSKGRKLQRFPTLFRCLLLIFLFTIWVGKFSSLVSSHASQRYFFLSPFILLQLLFLIFTDLNKPLFVRSYQSAQKFSSKFERCKWPGMCFLCSLSRFNSKTACKWPFLYYSRIIGH